MEIAQKAKTKKEFIDSWNEHIDCIVLLCNNFDDEKFDLMFKKITKHKTELKDIVIEASAKLTF